MPDKQNPQETKPIQRIILDTNIFSYISNKVQAIPFLLYLFDLSKRGFSYAYSDITLYELLRGTSAQKEADLIELLNPYLRYFLTDRVIITAAQLDNIMKIEKIDVNSVDHGDKFIAATAILTGSLILTANARDFPWPLFHEVESKPITFKEKKKTKCHVVALMRPDFDLISMRFNERPK